MMALLSQTETYMWGRPSTKLSRTSSCVSRALAGTAFLMFRDGIVTVFLSSTRLPRICEVRKRISLLLNLDAPARSFPKALSKSNEANSSDSVCLPTGIGNIAPWIPITRRSSYERLLNLWIRDSCTAAKNLFTGLFPAALPWLKRKSNIKTT